MNKSKTLNIKLIILVVGISIFGIIMQYSASSYNALKETGDAFFYVKKQSISLVVALMFMGIAMNVKSVTYYKLRYYIFGFSVIILALIFIPHLGVEKYGAKRWLNLGFFTIQPSEISKFGLMIFIASILSQRPAVNFKNISLVIVSMLIICGLIMLQPNMSITMLIGICTVIMMFVGGTKLKHFAVMSIPVLIAIPLLILAEPYRIKRILAFLDPWASPQNEGFQLIQSYYALAGGGIFGVGLFNSRQKYSFLPFAESDFIFSIIGEELGLFGVILLIFAFIYLIYLGVKIGINADSSFTSLLATGIVSIIGIQTMLNIAVVTGSIPPTGLPLPFISNGGSSLVVFFYAVGVLIRINNESHRAHLLSNCHKL